MICCSYLHSALKQLHHTSALSAALLRKTRRHASYTCRRSILTGGSKLVIFVTYCESLSLFIFHTVLMRSAASSSTEKNAASSPKEKNAASCSKEKHSSTVHTNPRWKDDLNANFKQLIVEKCSVMTREAFDDDLDIEVILPFHKFRH